jgi:hypothetical protein
MPQTPEQVQNLLRDIEAIYRRVGETNPFRNFDASAFNDVNDAISVLEQGLITGRRRLNDLINDAGELVSSFRAIVSEVTSGNVALKTTTKSFNGLTSIAAKLQADQAGINVLRKTELQSLQKQFEQEQLNLQTNKESLELRAQELAQRRTTQGLTAAEERELLKVQSAHQATVSLMHDQDSVMAELNNKLQERLIYEEKIEKAMGLGGAAVTATSTALNKLGLGGLAEKLGLGEVDKKMREMSETMAANGENTDTFASKMKVLKGGIKEAGENLVKNLKDPIAITALLTKEFIDALIQGDKETGELAKNFNLTYRGASNVRKELAVIAATSADVNVSTKALQESMVAVGRMLGSNAKLNEKDLVTFTKIREQSGITNENLASMQRFSLVTGGTLEDNTGEFLAQAQITAQNNGVVLNTKQLLEETANVSDAIKLSAGGTAAGFAKAAAQVKSLGMSLEKVDSISSSLLEFESSITAELEAELLLGKDLTLEKARQAALNGDLATVAEEISKQIGTAADFTGKNRIQQEALAKAVGMSRDELAKTLVEREALAGLSEEEAKAGKATFDNLVARYGVEKAQQMLKEEGLETLMNQQSIQERFNKSVEKLRDNLIAVAQPILDILSPLMDLVNFVLPAINLLLSPILEGFRVLGVAIDYIGSAWNWFVDKLEPIMPVLKGIGIAILAIISPLIMAAAAAAFMALAGIPIVGPVLAAAAALGTISFLTSKLTGIKIQDGEIAPDGGLVVSGKKGTYQLDREDRVVAMTDKGEKLQNQKSTEGGREMAMPSLDLSPMITELRAVKAVLQQILAKEGEVFIDSTKVGIALAVGTSKLK